MKARRASRLKEASTLKRESETGVIFAIRFTSPLPLSLICLVEKTFPSWFNLIIFILYTFGIPLKAISRLTHTDLASAKHVTRTSHLFISFIDSPHLSVLQNFHFCATLLPPSLSHQAYHLPMLRGCGEFGSGRWALLWLTVNSEIIGY